MSFDGETHGGHHDHRTGHQWVDMVVAFSALFISLISLGVAILHGRTMENMAAANARLVSANSWPFLSYSVGINTVDGDPTIHMRMYNTGVGPAKIESAELMWKGVPYRTDRDFLQACCGHDSAAIDFDSDLLMDEVLRANGVIRFLELKQSANPEVFARLKSVMLSRNLQLIVCYCSIFDECWKDDMTTFSLTPPRVKSCELSKVPFDQGLMDRRT